MIKGRIHSIETFGTVDGPGIRFIVFLQGCPLRCRYCHNRDTWEFGVGREVDVDTLVSEALKYKTYYQASGGGVSASGGESTSQPKFVEEFFKKLKENEIHTCLDTSGFVEIKNIEGVLNYTDLVLLDLKHMDDEKSIYLTSQSSSKAKELGIYLDKRNIPMWVRHVLVPGITDSYENIEAMARYVSSLNNVERFEFLPYHTLGIHKWEDMGKEYTLKNIKAADEEDVKNAKKIFLDILEDTGRNDIKVY